MNVFNGVYSTVTSWLPERVAKVDEDTGNTPLHNLFDPLNHNRNFIEPVSELDAALGHKHLLKVINVRNKKGATPFFLACRLRYHVANGSMHPVRIIQTLFKLIQAGSFVDTPTHDGQTALDKICSYLKPLDDGPPPPFSRLQCIQLAIVIRSLQGGPDRSTYQQTLTQLNPDMPTVLNSLIIDYVGPNSERLYSLLNRFDLNRGIYSPPTPMDFNRFKGNNLLRFELLKAAGAFYAITPSVSMTASQDLKMLCTTASGGVSSTPVASTATAAATQAPMEVESGNVTIPPPTRSDAMSNAAAAAATAAPPSMTKNDFVTPNPNKPKFVSDLNALSECYRKIFFDNLDSETPETKARVEKYRDYFYSSQSTYSRVIDKLWEFHNQYLMAYKFE